MTVIIIGYTLPDPDNGYHPALAGYHRRAAQRTVTLGLTHGTEVIGQRLVELLARRTSPQQWAEALWVATNAPTEVLDADPRLVVQLIRAAIEAQPAIKAAMRPVSVGDTVTVAGHRLACAPAGWDSVPTTPVPRPDGTPR